MNFDFLKPFAKLRRLYEYCEEADEFAISKAVVQKALTETQILFDSLMQEYFG